MKVPGSTAAPKSYSFLTTAEYFADLQQRTEKARAGERIVLVTLRLKAEEPAIERLISALCAAAERGVSIMVLVDAYHILIKETAGAVPGLATLRRPSSKRLPKFIRRRQDALERLRQAGVRCSVLNKPSRIKTNPFRGRSHIKFTVINDAIYIGGCNLDDPSYLDAMVSWHDADTADWLCTLAESFMHSGRVSTSLGGKDLEIPIDSTTSLLIDAGTSKQSLILDNAYDIIDTASTKLLVTYQFFPHGPVHDHLTRAISRGVHLTSYYNHPSKHRYPYNVIYGLLSWQMRRTSSQEFSSNRLPQKHDYLHAKILTSERLGMISSHNYMVAGVELGTAEIGLVSTDKRFIQQLNKTLLRQLQ